MAKEAEDKDTTVKGKFVVALNVIHKHVKAKGPLGALLPGEEVPDYVDADTLQDWIKRGIVISAAEYQKKLDAVKKQEDAKKAALKR